MRARVGNHRALHAACLFAALLISTAAVPDCAKAASLSIREPGGRGAAVVASRRLRALARRGDARAQAELGFAYENGYGVPQNYIVAVIWYRRAARRGNATAQYLLGLMYDRGLGVHEDTIAAQKWLILAAANAKGDQRDNYARIRDAVASKMSTQEVARAEALAYGLARSRRR